MITKPINTTLFFLGVTFAAISVLCSTLLWASFANTWLDMIIATITATALTVASYVFVPVIIRAFELKKPLTAIALLSLEIALISVSAAATIGWAESRFQSQNNNAIQHSDTYKNNQNQIDALNADIALLRQSASTDLENNFRERALRTMNKVDRLSEKRDELINQQYTPTNKNSGTALGNTLAENRWHLWTALAVLVEGCPLACFAIISMRNEKPAATEENKPEMPAKNIARMTNNTQELKEEIANGIKAGRWGDKPALRNVISDTKGRYPEVKAIFDDLLDAGLLKMNGQRFERVA